MAQYIGEIGSTDAQGVADILHTWGQLERDRQEAELTRVILEGASSGKSMDQVIADVLQAQSAQGQGAGGLTGLFRGVASRFMPPSQTMQILAGMGLAQATPQAQAELQGTQALTAQRQTQTRAAKQGMRESKAHGQIDLDQAEADLSKTRAQLEKMKKENDPAWMEYDHYSNMAVMQLNRLRHVDPLMNEQGYGEAMAGYDDAIRGMQQAWQRWQDRRTPKTPAQETPQPGAAQPWGEEMLPGPEQREEAPASVESFENRVQQLFGEQGESAARGYYDRWKGRFQHAR